MTIATELVAENSTGVYNMDDDELRAARDKFVALRTALRVSQDGMNDGVKYSTSAGRELMDEIDYYSRLIMNIECEMLMRLLEL